MSVEIAEGYISKTHRDYRLWIWCCRCIILILILVGLTCFCKAVRGEWPYFIADGIIVPLLWVVIRGHSAETSNYNEFLSRVNDTQVIANNQTLMAENIRLEEMTEKQRGE